MGIILKGILGGFSGKVGTVVGGNWKGIDYMRSLSSSTPSSFSPAQLSQQHKFRVAVNFLQTMTGLLAVTFKDYAIKMSGFNNALRYTLKNAVSGVYPATVINYNMALISRGDLPNAIAPAAAAAAGSNVQFTWSNNAGIGKAAPNDQAILVAYCEALNQTIYLTANAYRNTGSATLNLLPFAGRSVHTWLAFVSNDGKDLTNSVYTGLVIVS